LQKKQISFSFLVLAFNHESYIIEHLESIKYQILRYGQGIKVDILINDDCSRDKTVDYIEKWISFNKSIFNRVVVNYSQNNRGTCASVVDLLLSIETSLFKLTAGDDIYSFENIFEAAIADDNIAFKVGFPLFIEDGILRENLISNILTISTEVVYSKKSIVKHFTNFSYNNAPNMFYNLNCIKDIGTIKFIQNFDVTEDWPIQLAISRLHPQKKIKYMDKVLVYYRRTSGSTYIVANSRFINDKLKIFRFLIENSHSYLDKLRISIRQSAFKISNKYISRIINIDLHIYLFECFLNVRTIYNKWKNLNLDERKHVIHLEFIKNRAVVFLRDFINNGLT
jgi:hypothetical protein